MAPSRDASKVRDATLRAGVRIKPRHSHTAAVFKKLGPGLITGAADDDPSGIAAYSQAGAQFGYQLLWTLLFTYPLMVGIQLVSARIGRVSGAGLAGNMRKYYAPALLYGIVALLLIANTINIGADLGAMAEALALLIGGPREAYIVAIGLMCVVLESICCVCAVCPRP